MEVSLLEEAEIVGTTLGYSGSTTFQRLNCKFDVVVIDEAAQAVEPSTLVPLMNGAKRVLRVLYTIRTCLTAGVHSRCIWLEILISFRLLSCPPELRNMTTASLCSNGS